MNKETKVKKTTKGKFVVVTTDNTRRGVFGGYLESWDRDKAIAILTDAHMAICWSRTTKGVLGLASIGPQKGSSNDPSRISPPIPRIELNGVTAVMDTTKEAEKKWQSGIWD